MEEFLENDINITYAGMRRRWSKEELALLEKEFQGFQHPPGFSDIRRVQQLCPSLRERSLAQIKSRAWALVGLPRK